MRILPFFLLLSTFIWANDMTEKGLNLFASGKPKEAYGVLEKSFLRTKDPQALYYMGHINFVDFKKYLEGMRQINSAAQLGYPEAMFQVASTLYKSRKYNEARNWLLKASKKGHPKSSYFLGYMYEMGIGVSKSASRARYWYKKAGLE